MNEENGLPVAVWSTGPGAAHEYLERNVHPEDVARWLDACVRAFDRREAFEIEYRLRAEDGAYRWVLDRGVPRVGADGAFLGYVGASTDVEHLKREQAELARALDEERRRRRDVPAAPQEPVLAGVRVLVVENDAVERGVLLRLLAAAGAETRAASNTAEALRALGAWRPDVLLSVARLNPGLGV